MHCPVHYQVVAGIRKEGALLLSRDYVLLPAQDVLLGQVELLLVSEVPPHEESEALRQDAQRERVVDKAPLREHGIQELPESGQEGDNDRHLVDGLRVVFPGELLLAPLAEDLVAAAIFDDVQAAVLARFGRD